WVQGWAPDISKQDAESIGVLGVNALLGKRATSAVFRGAARDIADEDYVVEWTALLAMRIESLR
ncbi:TetR/AcrR family transcriptional regulator, partial [Mycobacteroides abscessus subsp. abscessus]